MSEELQKFAAKTGATIAINAVLPGYGCVVDIADGINDFRKGKTISGIINFISAGVSLVSFGLSSSAKQAVKSTVKQAGVQSAKKIGKQATQEIGRKAAIDIAKGGSKKAIVQSAKTASKQVTKKVGQELGRDLAKGLINESIEEGLRMAGQMNVPQTVLNAIAKGTVLNEIPKMGIETAKHLTADFMEKGAEHLLKTEGMKSAFKAATTTAAHEAMKPVIKREVCIKLCGSVVSNYLSRDDRSKRQCV